MSNNRFDGVDLDVIRYGALVPSAVQHVYVSAAAGNDANDGSSAAKAKATLASAVALVPTLLGGMFIIHCASGSYQAPATPPSVDALNRYAMIAIVGDGGGQAGDDGFTQVASLTAGSGSTNGNVVSTTSSMTVDQHQGAVLEVLTGAAAGCRRTLNGNTTTTLQLDYPLVDSSGNTVAMVAGATFRIVRPAVVITANVDGMSGTALSQGVVPTNLVNVALSGAGYWLQSARGGHYNFGVELRSSAFFYGQQRQTFGATGSSGPEWGREIMRYMVQAITAGTVPTRWEGWGLSQAAGETGGIADGGTTSFFAGYFVGTSIGMGGDQNSVVWLGGRMRQLTLYRSGSLYIGGALPCRLEHTAQALCIQSNSNGGSYRVMICGDLAVTTTDGSTNAVLFGGDVQVEHVVGTFSITVTGANIGSAALMLDGHAALHAYQPLVISAVGRAMSMDGNAQAYFYSAIGWASAGAAQNAISLNGNASLTLKGNLNLQHTGTAAALYAADNSQVALAGAWNGTVSNAAFGLEGNARFVSANNINVAQGAQSYVQHNASFLCLGLVLSGSPSGALLVRDRAVVETLVNSLSLSTTANGTPVLDVQDGLMLCKGTMSLVAGGAGTAAALSVTGGGRLTCLLGASLTTAAQAFLINRNAQVLFESTFTANSTGVCSVISDYAKVSCRGAFILGCSAQALALFSSAELNLNGGVAITGSIANWGAVSCQGGTINFSSGTSKAIANTNTGANADGVRCVAGGTLATLTANPSLSTTGSSGFGFNCSSGGRFLTNTVPTNVSGPTAAFQCDGVNFAAADVGASGLTSLAVTPPPLTLPVSTSSTAFTFDSVHVGRSIRNTNALQCTATIPLNFAAMPIGTIISGMQIGAGRMVFAKGDPSIVINCAGQLSTRTAGSPWCLYKAAANEYDLTGDLLP